LQESATVKSKTPVSKVEFYNGDTLISSDTTAPYTAKITGAAVGAYNLKAVAVLSDGRRIESPVTPVLVKVIVKPTVKLTAPKSNVVAYGNEFLKITATASDSDGKISRVDFLVDGEVIGSDREAPYEYEWKADDAASTKNICKTGTGCKSTVFVRKYANIHSGNQG